LKRSVDGSPRVLAARERAAGAGGVGAAFSADSRAGTLQQGAAPTGGATLTLWERALLANALCDRHSNALQLGHDSIRGDR
jgi:hypothetical protein